MAGNPGTLFREIDPPHGLLPSVLARIAVARRRAARLRFAASGTLALVSVLILVPAVQYAASEFYASGFSDYASLFFDSLSGGFSRELLYSLLDSLPSLALLILASAAGALLWSLKRTNRDARIAFAPLSLPA
ncbi:MAG: hypothetical protein KGH56_00365 [Patescibacteria group bacterium]|nr:hypothetical protein [Patescibacteria group bacterium]